MAVVIVKVKWTTNFYANIDVKFARNFFVRVVYILPIVPLKSSARGAEMFVHFMVRMQKLFLSVLI